MSFLPVGHITVFTIQINILALEFVLHYYLEKSIAIMQNRSD